MPNDLLKEVRLLEEMLNERFARLTGAYETLELAAKVVSGVERLTERLAKAEAVCEAAHKFITVGLREHYAAMVKAAAVWEASK